MQKYKSTGNRGLFDEQENMSKLSAKGNPLDRISKVIDFEMFRVYWSLNFWTMSIIY